MRGEWEVTRVDYVASVQARIGWKALTAAEYQDKGFAFLSTPNIKTERIDFDNVNYISEFRYNESPELKLELGDVLLAKDGSTLGITNVVREIPRPATVNGSIAVIRPRLVEPRFLMYVLRGSIVQSWIQQVKDGMGVPHLFQEDIRKLSFSAPACRLDQGQIADFLDDQVARIDNVVAAREKQVELEDDALSATLRELLLDGATVPARRLLREAVVGIVVQPSKYYVDADVSGIPALRGLNVVEREISTENLVRISHEGHWMHPRSRLRTGDVVVVRTGDAGAASQVPSWADDWNAIDLVVLRVDEVTDSRYLMHALNANRREQVIAASSSGSIQQHFGVGAVGDLPIVYRDPAEQALIAAAADSAYVRADERKSLLRKSIRLFQELKRSLITAAVTGEFDVSSADGSRVPV